MKKYINKIVASSGLILIDQGVFSGANFLITIFLAHQLSLFDFGLFSSINILTFLFLSASNSVVIQPFQVTWSTIENKKQYFTFLNSFQFLVLFVFIAIIVVANLFSVFEQLHTSIYVVIVFIIGYLFQDFYRKFFLATNKVKDILCVDIFFSLLVSISFFFFKSSLTLHYALLIIGISNVLSAVYVIYYLIKDYEFPVLYKSWFKLHFDQGKWLISVAFLQWCTSNLFVMLSGTYLGVEALGALRLVQSIFGVINILLQTVENYFIPKVAHLYVESFDKAKKYLINLTLNGLVVFAVLLSFLFLFSKQVILLFGGENYVSYHFVIQMMTLLYFFIFLSYPTRIAVRVLILNKIFFLGYVLSLLSSLLSFHFLLQNYGLRGAIIGLTINQIVMIGYWYFELYKKQLVLWK